jgi:tetratricopeptide (TPR) repeat protein
VLLAAGCAHGAATRNDGAAVPWRELTSRHFVLRTDVDSERAHKLLTDLERQYIALVGLDAFTFMVHRVPDGPVNVVVFRKSEDFLRSLPELGHHRGITFRRDEAQFIIVREPVDTQLLSHELMHEITGHFLWRAPIWLNEGLATFFSSLVIDHDRLVFGTIPLRMRQRRFPPLARVLRADGEEFHGEDEAGYYAAAAMLVYMFNSDNDDDRRKFVAYVAALANGSPAEEAWRKTLGAIPIEDLERRLAAHRNDRGENFWTTTWIPPQIPPSSERILSDFERKLLIVRISDWSKTSRPWISQLLDQLHAERPTDPDALYWSAYFEYSVGDRTKAKQLLVAAAKANPEGARAWHWLSHAELADMEKVPKSERRPGPALEELRRRAHTADELNEVAWYLSEIGKPTEAIPYIVHALEKTPGCYYCRDTMAQIFFQKGALARAIDEQRLALNLTPEHASSMRRTLAERLAKYEKAAKEAASAPKPSLPATTPDASTPSEAPQSEPPP